MSGYSRLPLPYFHLLTSPFTPSQILPLLLPFLFAILADTLLSLTAFPAIKYPSLLTLSYNHFPYFPSLSLFSLPSFPLTFPTSPPFIALSFHTSLLLFSLTSPPLFFRAPPISSSLSIHFPHIISLHFPQFPTPHSATPNYPYQNFFSLLLLPSSYFPSVPLPLFVLNFRTSPPIISSYFSFFSSSYTHTLLLISLHFPTLLFPHSSLITSPHLPSLSGGSRNCVSL